MTTRYVSKRPSPPNPHGLYPHELDEFEERAAIMEYDGNVSREEAELMALNDTRRKK